MQTRRTIEVFGSGPDCARLEATAREAAVSVGVSATFRRVTDYGEMLRRGVPTAPGLAIDGVVVSAGRFPAAEAIAGWLVGRS